MVISKEQYLLYLLPYPVSYTHLDVYKRQFLHSVSIFSLLVFFNLFVENTVTSIYHIDEV